MVKFLNNYRKRPGIWGNLLVVWVPVLKNFCGNNVAVLNQINKDKLIESALNHMIELLAKRMKKVIFTKVMFMFILKNSTFLPRDSRLCDTLTVDFSTNHIKRRRFYHKIWGPKVSWGKEATLITVL